MDDFVQAVRACSLSSAVVKKLRIASFRAAVNTMYLINAIGGCFPALLSLDLLVDEANSDSDMEMDDDDADNGMDVDNSNTGYSVSHVVANESSPNQFVYYSPCYMPSAWVLTNSHARWSSYKSFKLTMVLSLSRGLSSEACWQSSSPIPNFRTFVNSHLELNNAVTSGRKTGQENGCCNASKN
jgi:hypothetical protein